MPHSQPTRWVKGSLAASYSLFGLSKALLALIFFLLPTQLGLHFWPDSALVYGVRVDYLAPTLYFLDLLIILYLFVAWFSSARHKIRNPKYQVPNTLAPILLSNLLFSTNPPASLSWSLHLLLYFIFIYSIPNNALRIMYYALPITSLFQLVLAAFQVDLGHALQGPLYYLGERMLSVGQPGVATGSLWGNIVLRSYGTFGHPNVLAGWLLIASLLVYNLKPKPIIRYSIFFLPALGVLLTQSRAAALALFVFTIPIYLLKSARAYAIYFAAALIAASCLLITNPLPRADLSLSERLDLQRLSLQVIQKYPLFGTGANASVSTYPGLTPTHRLLQPDHNSFTLLLSWFGVFGVIATFYFFRICLGFRSSNFGLIQSLLPFLPLLPLLLLDHYLLTSPQGLLTLLLYLRVTMNHKS